MLSLGRPGNQARVILMSVGLGCFFVLGVRAVQNNLLESFRFQLGTNSPDLVLIDVQRDQVDGVRSAVAPYVTAPPRLMPLLRGRVVGVDGKRVNLPTPDDVRRSGGLTREFGLTFRDALQDNERLVAGAFWSGPLTEATTPDGFDTEVSIEQMVNTEEHVEVGDKIRFDVGGRVLRARVTSIRKVTWDEAQNGGFVFVLRPGPAVERDAAHLRRVHRGGKDAGSARRACSAIWRRRFRTSRRSTCATCWRRSKRSSTTSRSASRSWARVTLTGGILILVGAVAMTKFQRLYEAAIYRTLGASTRMIASMVAIEYSLLGALAGLMGSAGALALSWVLARWLFDIEWRPAPGLLAAGVVITTVAVGLVGLAASADVLIRKPLATLRNE